MTYKQEKQQMGHLLILLCGTIFILSLIAETLLLGWNTECVLPLLAALLWAWWLYFTEKLTPEMRIWIYFVLILTAFFIYGIHETSIYDLAPVMLFVIIAFSTVGNPRFIRVCAAVYYLTMCYDYLFVVETAPELTVLFVTRLLMHLIAVIMAAHIAIVLMERQRKEAEDQDTRIAEMEEVNHRMENFLTNVSHELRTPINAVTGITGVMLKSEEDAEKKKELYSIQLAGHRLFSQIEDILDYTEIDTGKITVGDGNYMISSVINDILTELRMLERAGGPELIVDVDAGIPNILYGDGRKIKKVIRHIVDNALKFTREGAVYARIYVMQRSYGVNLCIRVSDTGVGIDDASMDKIMENFFQSSAGRQRRVGGLGLGLSIVYGMVTAMEGFMQVESTEGDGTTVSISIPQKTADPSPCMTLPEQTGICPACYLKPGKYTVPKVRDYYNELIKNMVQSLDMTLYRVSSMDELKSLVSMYQLTHLLIGNEEYEENCGYFEELTRQMDVIVAADSGFVLPPGSGVRCIKKPFCSLSVMSALHSRRQWDVDGSVKNVMICPGIRVLVVDDEPMNLMVAEGIFKGYQMEVKTAESGMEALDICRKEKFDLIFLDHMMPEMDGVETLKRLRGLEREPGSQTTVIAFTANAVSSAREMLLKEGFDEFVSKPVEEAELERILRKVLPAGVIHYVDAEEQKRLTARKAEQAEAEEDTGQETEQGEADTIDRLERLGFHTQAGIRYCYGDRSFYETLLSKFVQDKEQKAAGIGTAYKEENLGQYRILVHALKSTAKMIGADELSDMARRAEDAAKEQDAAYIRAHHGELMAYYDTVTEQISTVLNGGEENGEADAAEQELLENGKLSELLQELRGYLDTCESECAEKLLEKLMGYRYRDETVHGLFEDIARAVDDFEFDAASDTLEKLAETMEGGDAE